MNDRENFNSFNPNNLGHVNTPVENTEMVPNQNPVLVTNTPPTPEETRTKDPNQKLLLLAIILFTASLMGMAFYYFGGFAKKRLGGSKLPLPTPQPTVIETKTDFKEYRNQKLGLVISDPGDWDPEENASDNEVAKIDFYNRLLPKALPAFSLVVINEEKNISQICNEKSSLAISCYENKPATKKTINTITWDIMAENTAYYTSSADIVFNTVIDGKLYLIENYSATKKEIEDLLGNFEFISGYGKQEMSEGEEKLPNLSSPTPGI